MKIFKNIILPEMNKQNLILKAHCTPRKKILKHKLNKICSRYTREKKCKIPMKDKGRTK